LSSFNLNTFFLIKTEIGFLVGCFSLLADRFYLNTHRGFVTEIFTVQAPLSTGHPARFYIDNGEFDVALFEKRGDYVSVFSPF
jgi:hypothetical protein